jgi:hypothetical protein
LARRFDSHGFEVIPTPPGGGLTVNEHDAIRDAVEGLVKSDPIWFKNYDAITDPAKKLEFLDKIIKDTRYAGAVRKAINEYAAMEALPPAAETTSDALKAAEAARKTKNDELIRIQGEVNATNAEWLRFDRSTSMGGIYNGPDAKDMQQTEALLPSLKGEIARLTDVKKNAEANVLVYRQALQRFEQGTRGGRPIDEIRLDLDVAEQAVEDAAQKIVERQARIDRLDELKKKEEKLGEKRTTLNQQLTAAKTELQTADDAIGVAKRNSADAVSTRERLEKARVAAIEGVFVKAAREVMNIRNKEFTDAWPTAIETFKTEAKSRYEMSVWNQLDARWNNPAKIQPDMNVLLRPNGQEAYIRRILKDTINPNTGNKYDSAAAAGAPTPEIDAMIADKDFMAGVKDKATLLLLAKADMRKGGISKQDARIIATSTWGQDLLKNAYDNNDAARAVIDRNGGRKALNNPDFFSRVKDEWGGKSLLWAILLGIPVAAALGSAAIGTLDAKLSN